MTEIVINRGVVGVNKGGLFPHEEALIKKFGPAREAEIKREDTSKHATEAIQKANKLRGDELTWKKQGEQNNTPSTEANLAASEANLAAAEAKMAALDPRIAEGNAMEQNMRVKKAAEIAKKQQKTDKTRTIIVSGITENLREWQRNHARSEQPAVYAEQIDAFLRIQDALPPGALKNFSTHLESLVRASATITDAEMRLIDSVLHFAKPFIAQVAPEKGSGLVTVVPDNAIQHMSGTAARWGSETLSWLIKTRVALGDNSIPFGERVSKIYHQILDPLPEKPSEKPNVTRVGSFNATAKA
jgi:hypothetical protein